MSMEELKEIYEEVYCEEFRYEWGDSKKPMTFEEFCKDVEQYGRWWEL